MTSYDIDAVGYILDNYNKNALKQLSEEELHQLIYEECDKLSWANEECDFSTFGENYSHDVDFYAVYDYIKKILEV